MTTHPTTEASSAAAQRTSAVDALIRRLTVLLGDKAVITDEARRRTYECDGLAAYAVVPAVVVLTTSADQVREVVSACHDLGVPFVARGSGTGLSGGALPVADGALVVLSQLRDILHVDPLAQRAVVQPGVINLDVTAAPQGRARRRHRGRAAGHRQPRVPAADRLGAAPVRHPDGDRAHRGGARRLTHRRGPHRIDRPLIDS